MEIQIKSPNGVKLLTSKKYCPEDIEVVPALQDKTVTPTDTAQTVTPDVNYAGLKSVTVEPGTVTADATATADDIRLGKTAYGADGKMTGTIADYDGTAEPTSGKSLFQQRVDGSITEVTAGDLAGIVKIYSLAFYNVDNLVNVTIPNGVTTIGASAFSLCTSLMNVTIPDSVTRIETQTFYNCSTATELGGTYIILATTPPTIQSSTFQNAKINKIIVPVGTSAAYKAATNWSALADKIEEATE